MEERRRKMPKRKEKERGKVLIIRQMIDHFIEHDKLICLSWT